MGPLGHCHTFSVLTVMVWDRWDTLTILVYLELWYGTAGKPSFLKSSYRNDIVLLGNPHSFSVLTFMLWDRWETSHICCTYSYAMGPLAHPAILV
jgi:hypothetical protein